MSKTIIRTQLPEANPEYAESEGNKPIEVEIVVGEGTIDIRPVGYGQACAADGYGEPIWLEQYDGKLKLRVWSDINQEDPTHSIDMEGAREDRRKING